jgi:N-acetylglucosaminyldiphosphoundecaprenol N-acetyl-beta-D-mannosaminyltransferase
MESSTRTQSCRQVLGISFDPLTMTQAVARCVDSIDRHDYLSIGVVNAAKVVAMRKDRPLRTAVTNCHMILADGQSVVWASHVLRAPLPERVAGIDLFWALLAVAEKRGDRVFFLGARPEVLALVLEQVGRQFPTLRVAGSHHGYFTAEEEADVAEQIRKSGANVLFAGMSSPKKELFLDRWGKDTGANVVHGVGGSFDILAGVTKRAPLWYQKHGLEWLYRAQQEPMRLGSRYLRTNFAFMAMVAREALATRGAQVSPGEE